MRSSDIFLVSVVTSTRSLFSARSLISCHQVVDLALGRLDDHLRVDQAGRPDHLLDHVAADPLQLVRPRRGRQVQRLADALAELVPGQRPVVDGARQPEAVLDQDPLAGHVALVHGPDLRHRVVRLVDDQQEVLGEVVEQRVGRAARPRGRRCAGSSSRCPSSCRPGASSPRRRWCACAAAAPPAACPAAPSRPAAPPARPRCRRWPAPSARARPRSARRGRCTARRPRSSPRRSAGAASSAARPRRRTSRSRTASSSYCGMTSMVSPRTRNVPRVKARSLRVYCMPTSRRSSWSRSIVSPTRSLSMRSTYSCGRAQAVDARHRGDHDRVAAG